MTARTDTERILDAYLAPEADRLADRVLDAALDDIARTPQRRALRVPWRFPTMPAMSRATAIAAVALVAAVGAGGLIYLSSRAPSGPGGPATATSAPTTAPPAAPGIAAWTPYTSEMYGFKMAYPSDWTVYAPATRGWESADGRAAADSWPYADVFANPEVKDGDSIGVWVWEVAADEGADIESLEGLKAWAQEFCTRSPAIRDGGSSSCDEVPSSAMPMCLNAGGDSCRAAILVPDAGGANAFFEDFNRAMLGRSFVRVVQVGRPDTFPAAERYGGSVQLLRSFLTTMDVWTLGQQPRP